MINQISHRCSDVFDSVFMYENGIEPHEHVFILSGKDLCPHLLGFKGPLSRYRDYNFFLFENRRRYKSVRRLFECIHPLDDGSKCGLTTSDMCKLFAHSAVHTKEKHYICRVDGCGKLFSLKGNINRHIKITHGLEMTNANLEDHLINS